VARDWWPVFRENQLSHTLVSRVTDHGLRIMTSRAGHAMNLRLFSTAALAAGLLAGCGAARPSKFYQITVPGDSAVVAPPNPFPVSLLIGPLRTSHLYREDHIVYRSSGESMGAYLYDRWAESPSEMLGDVLLRDLRISGKYRSVENLRSNSRGDYTLHGRLYDFEEVSGPPLVARVTVDLELRENKTDTTVWTHFYTHDEPVSEKNVSAVVAALDRNAQRGMKEVESSLDQYFSTHPSNQANQGNQAN
jgi:ABC-type uncharacterized transport system auxiliary subunit